ncbi:MAG: ribonuclease III [Verrucomicrobiota bacterium]
MQPDYTAFESAIGYQFQDPSLLALALTHPSCELEIGDNQRLEFLGDAILGMAVASALYQRHPAADEGALARMRASLINGRSLATRAHELGIGPLLQVSKAHAQHRPEPSESMLEDAFEALIGAIYEDAGYAAAEKAILSILDPAIAKVSEDSTSNNPKGRLQEWSQAQHHGQTPTYRTIAEEGPDHAKAYTVTVSIAGQEIARATGSSVKQAQAEAAKLAIEKTRA